MHLTSWPQAHSECHSTRITSIDALFSVAQQPPVCQDLVIIEASRSHDTRYVSSGRMISPTQRPLPANTQKSQETDIHAACGIRTRNPSKRATADPSFRLRGRWDRRFCALLYTFLCLTLHIFVPYSTHFFPTLCSSIEIIP